MPNWDDFYDRDELAEQREQFGIEYDDYNDRNYADNYDSEGRYFGKDEPFDPSGADPDEDDGLTTDDWDNWPGFRDPTDNDDNENYRPSGMG